jgi:hypothetical protein
MTYATNTPSRPWYRHYWVWLIMIPPASAVVAGFITAWLAGAPPALVVDDYSEIAMATEQQRSRDRRAGELGVFAQVELARDTLSDLTRIELLLSASESGYRLPDQLQLRLIHPTDELKDQVVIMDGRDGRFAAVVDSLQTRFYLQLEDLEGQWRLVGELPAAARRIELAPRETS